ncbi:sulfotransferase family protein [Nonomuraea sp. B5E05]|uniref:sulfotransferase family protein n=1 Tax=Nonomuraea sp. B5E05 TaxID=3153569 RepID=UPI00325FFDFA
MTKIDVIGVGLPRTGTTSLKAALENLGIDPCHHMQELAVHPDRAEPWAQALATGTVQWETALHGYRSAVDWPSAYFWRELVMAYPESKVILTVRDPQDWYTSMRKTIFTMVRAPESMWGVPGVDAIRSISARMWINTFGNGPGVVMPAEREAVELFERHTAQVIESIPSDRLLVHEAAHGWAPLCAFLGLTAPAGVPYPHHNSSVSAQAVMDEVRQGGTLAIPNTETLPSIGQE